MPPSALRWRTSAEVLHRKAEGGMGRDQDLVLTREQRGHRLHLGLGDPRIVDPRRVAEVPLRLHRPVPVEAVPGQRLIGETAADRALRDCLLYTSPSPRD